MKLLLIDGHSLAYRAFYALPPLSNSSGTPTQAVLGVVNMTLKILEDEKPTHMIVFFDRGVPAFRKEAYEDYKATRKAPPDDFLTQLPLIEEFFKILHVPVISEPGYEADDWIAAAANQAEKNADEILILSADLDLLQLVGAKTVLLASQKGTSRFIRYTVQEMEKRFGVSPAQWVDLKALVGDASDNIKGISGLGSKTAADLLRKWGSIDNLFLCLPELPEKLKEKFLSSKDQIALNRQLVTLRSDAPLDFQPDSSKISSFPQKELREFFEKLDFRKLISRLGLEEKVKAEPVDFLFVENGEDLGKAMQSFHKSVHAALFLWPFPAPFLDRHFLTLDFGNGGRYVISQDYFHAALQEMVSSVALEKDIFTYNWKAFELACRQEKIKVPGWKVHDTLITGWLCNSLLTNPSLPDLARNYLKTPLQEPIPEKQEELPLFLACWTSVLSTLAKELQDKLHALSLEKLYNEIEFPLISILAEMEQCGVSLDLDYLKTLSSELNEELSELEGDIYKEAGVIFNLNSSKQLAEILYGKLLLPKGKKTKTGYSTNVEELERLAEQSPLALKLLQYRELSKLQNTYVDVFPKMINPRTGRLHTTYVQTGTATGRFSSKEPNLQNIPIRTAYGKKMRRAFVAGKPGWKLLGADYSQIELRLLAHLSKDQVLIDAFRGHEDIHARTACEVFGVSPESVTPEMRRFAKTVNFGIIYGMTEHGLSQSLGIKREDAREYIKKYLNRFPNIEAYIRESLEEARESGMTRTLLGRVRFVPELQSQKGYERQQAERIGINAPLQGSAADLIKLAMISVRKRLFEEQSEAFMVMQVHDELVFEVPEDKEKETALMVREEMENVLNLNVPLIVDIATGKNWADMERIELDQGR